VTWFRVDDSLAFHQKTVAAGNAAMGLWVRAGSWSSQHLTDGHLTPEMTSALGARAEVKRLVDVGLWHDRNHTCKDCRVIESGYLFHDWEQANPTRLEVEAERERKRAAGKAGGLASGRSRREAPASATAPAPAQASDAASVRANGSAVLPEARNPRTHTLPSAPTGALSSETSSPRGPRKRATQAPDSLLVTAEMRQWAHEQGIRVDLDRETAAFLDFHRSKGTAFKDWVAAWRTWMRNTLKFGRQPALVPEPEPGQRRWEQ
jgi:hypothetical protein